MTNKIKKATSIENNEFNAEITQKEIVRAIKGVRKESSPGLDGTEYSMFKWIPQEYISLITKLFNVFWTEGRLPISWKEYQVLFIDKQYKESVRSIALSSCFGKLYKRVVCERLNFWTEKNKILDQEQYGFRKGRSCLDNILRLYINIKDLAKTRIRWLHF